MTSKNSFFLNVRENIKRRSAVLAVFGIYFFFAFPVVTAVYIHAMTHDVEQSYLPALLENIRSGLAVLLGANMVTTFFITLLALLCGIQGFSWLHQRSKVDLYHALPISKARRFFVIYLNGILSFAACYLTALLLSLLVCAVMSVPVGPMLYGIVICFLLNMLLYACIYGLSVVCVLLTGNTVITCFAVLILLFYETVCRLLYSAFCEIFFDTSVSFSRSYAATGLFTPIFNLQTLLNDQTQALQLAPDNLKYVLLLVLYALLMFGIAAFVYIKCPAENCGKALSFPHTRVWLKCFLLLPFALVFCLLFYSLTYSLWFSLFGLILGLALGHCILEAIFDFDLKSVLRHKVSLGICSLAALGIFCSFAFDWFGYDRYVPAEASLLSAAWKPVLSSDNGQNYLEFGGPSPRYNSELPLETMELTDTNAIISLAQAAVEAQAQEDILQPVYFTVKYNLKSGREVYRRLTVDYTNARTKELLNTLYSQPACKQSLLQLYDEDFTARLAAMKPLVRYHGNVEPRDFADLSFAQFVEVYREDFTASTFDECYTTLPCGSFRIILNPVFDKDEQRYYPSNYTLQFPLYSTFSNTLEWLEQQGIDYAFFPDVSEVTRIDINGYLSGVTTGPEKHVYLDSSTTDRALICRLLPLLLPVPDDSYNYSYMQRSNITVTVFSTLNGSPVSSSFTFASTDDIPASLLPQS